MTVTTDQIAKVQAAGFQNVEAIANACDATGCMFYLAVAMIEKESKGRNVYGSDKGGALSGFPKLVNRGNFEVFEWLIFTKNQTSNGVGPTQITDKGFFTQMKNQDLNPWEPAHNIFFGVRLLYGYYQTGRKTMGRHDSIRYAGTKYNGAEAYGDSLLEVALRWKNIVGNVDYS